MKLFPQSEVLTDLGITSDFAIAVGNILERRTNAGVLTILEVNESARELHRRCFSENYPAILKPIYIKSKSQKDSILSPFLAGFKEAEGVRGNLEMMPLHFPMAHLRHLHYLGYIQLVSAKNGYLVIRDKNSRENYYINLAELNLDEAETFFDRKFYDENVEVTIMDKRRMPVEVVGVNDHGEKKLVIADIDAHAFGERPRDGIELHSYDTSRGAGRDTLAEALKQEFKSHPGDYPDDIQTMFLDIPDTMGYLTMREYCTFFWINYEFNRIQGDERVLQHGSTSFYPLSHYSLSESITNSRFPSIEKDKRYGAIFPGGSLVSLPEEEVLAFYQIMRLRKYNFKLNPSWMPQLRKLELEDVEDLEAALVRAKLIEERSEPIQQSDISNATQDFQAVHDFWQAQYRYLQNKEVGAKGHLGVNLVPRV